MRFERAFGGWLRRLPKRPNRIDRANYFKYCWPNSEKIKAFDFINLVPDGDRVFVTYEGQEVNGDTFRNTEIVMVRDGQIVEVEVYFGWSIPHKAKPGVHLPVTEDQVGTVERPAS